MRRAILLIAVAAAVAVVAAPALGGSSIKHLPDCQHTYLLYGPGSDRNTWRAAFLCLLNGARKAEHLPALKQSSLLAGIAQAQSDKFERTGSANHGKSVTEIGKRMSRKGYRPAAYDEAFGILDTYPTPYSALYAMVGKHGLPCSQLFDPRMRDVGIGISHGGFVGTAALEFGLRAGSKQPSTNTLAQKTCGHPIAKPAVVGPIVRPRSGTFTDDTTIAFTVACMADTTCKFTGTVTLSSAKASDRQEFAIKPHTTPKLTFTFDAADLAKELAAKRPAFASRSTSRAPRSTRTASTCRSRRTRRAAQRSGTWRRDRPKLERVGCERRGDRGERQRCAEQGVVPTRSPAAGAAGGLRPQEDGQRTGHGEVRADVDAEQQRALVGDRAGA